MIFVITLKAFHFNILVKGSIHIPTPFDIKLKTIKRFLPSRFVIHIDTFYIVHMVAFKQLLYCTLHNCSLHLVFKFFRKNTIKLLHVMLHERIICVPSKGLRQLFCCYTGITVLELIEQTLQS
nr:hypothetical protein Iba_chr05aCG13740 [Ipomoea batatas]